MEIGGMIKETVEVNANITMIMFMKDNGKKIRGMAMVALSLI
jgi:hypothetical protein